MTEREVILPLEREYTLKEQMDLLYQQNDNLIKQLQAGRAVNEELKRKINSFIQSEIPPEGSNWVKIKAHSKLQKKYQELDKRFWEIVKEFDDYKKHIQLTVLSHIKK